MNETMTNIGFVAHYRHHSGILCPVKTGPQKVLEKPPAPITRVGKQSERLFVFALPGCRELVIPERAVSIRPLEERR